MGPTQLVQPKQSMPPQIRPHPKDTLPQRAIQHFSRSPHSICKAIVHRQPALILINTPSTLMEIAEEDRDNAQTDIPLDKPWKQIVFEDLMVRRILQATLCTAFHSTVFFTIARTKISVAESHYYDRSSWVQI